MSNELTQTLRRVQSKANTLREDFQVRATILESMERDFNEAEFLIKSGAQDDAVLARIKALETKLGEATLDLPNRADDAPTLGDALNDLSRDLAQAAILGNASIDNLCAVRELCHEIAEAIAGEFVGRDTVTEFFERAAFLTQDMEAGE